MTNFKKYYDVIGLPSGEVLNLPLNIINILKDKRMVRKDAIDINGSFTVYYVFDDDKLLKLFDFLSNLDENLW